MTNLEQVGHYRIEIHLGSGAYTDTYRAVDTVRRRPVALKLLKVNQLPDELLLPRLLGQAALAADLIHPHIAWMWETGEADGFYYLAERYVNGPPLNQLLAESGSLPWEQALKVVQQIAQGLDFAHARGWVHAEVTSQNILLSPELGAVLTDFGLMKAIQVGSSDHGGRETLGLSRYISPEVRRGEAHCPASDQYALACVLVELISDQSQVDASTIAEKHLSTLHLLQTESNRAPWYVMTALKRALDEDPAQRYPSASEFAASPEKLAALADEDPTELARRTVEAGAWRALQEQARRQAEEEARLAALKQARREIEEQLRLETETYASRASDERPKLEDVEEDRRAPPRPRARRSQAWRPWWPVWMGVVILLITLAGFWLDSRLPAGVLFPDTPTPTSPPSTATLTATHTGTPTASDSPTITPTASSTATRTSTRTPTHSLTPTSTQTPNPSLTHTQTPTIEPTEKDLDRPVSRHSSP